MKKFCIKENIVLYIFSINTAVDLRDKETITNGKYAALLYQRGCKIWSNIGIAGSHQNTDTTKSLI